LVGFALWHIHPGFAVLGTVCFLAVALWFLIAVPYAIAHRRDIELREWMMTAASVAVIVALAVPNTFFARCIMPDFPSNAVSERGITLRPQTCIAKVRQLSVSDKRRHEQP